MDSKMNKIFCKNRTEKMLLQNSKIFSLSSSTILQPNTLILLNFKINRKVL